MEALQLDITIGLRAQDAGALRLDLAGADAHLAHAVHQLADELELEAGLAEGVDAAVRLAQDAGGFEGVVDVVR